MARYHERGLRMTANNMLRLVGRSVAIACFSVAARMRIARFIPSARMRRWAEIAGLQDLKYGGIFSRSSYTPWRGDAEFRDVFAAVRANTLVDEYRCHEL